jgi:hypothetical protein
MGVQILPDRNQFGLDGADCLQNWVVHEGLFSIFFLWPVSAAIASR